MDNFQNMEQLIKNNNISRRELSKFNEIVKNYQPTNIILSSLLQQYTYRNIDNNTLKMFDKTIDALFESLDYPTQNYDFDDEYKIIRYKLVKDSIIEYCTTDVKDMNTIIDNVAFLNNMDVEDVKKGMQSYMSSYGDVVKIMNAFSIYSDDYKSNVRKSTLPETYIPIYSKAVVEKIKEMKDSKQK